MARAKEKQKAIELRLKGMSYSQIKEKLGISKSTLSGWLLNYPLSSRRIRELRDKNPRRIENYRNTMRKKREKRIQFIYDSVSKQLGELNDREMLVAGFFLYWGEGSKTRNSTVSLSNTDAGMIRFFIKWLKHMKVPKNKLSIKLHLYSDMDKEKEMNYWSKEIKLPLSQFTKPYIKKNKLSGLTYSGFGHGTCLVRFYNQALNDHILSAIQYFRTA